MSREPAPPPEPSIDKLRRRLIDRIEAVANIDVLLAYEVVLSQLDFPYDDESAVEGFLAVADLVRANRRLQEVLNEIYGQEPS
jgi:hypothetical protein